jgi:hypothetical protein
MQENSNQLPANISKIEEGRIPQAVAVSNLVKDFENKKVTFSFEPYNNNQCEIANIDKKEAKKLTGELKKMSLTLQKHFRHQTASGIACKAIHNSGNYSVLFTDVPPDVELLEVDYSGPGRIFGYLVHNIFNVVAIGKKHR